MKAKRKGDRVRVDLVEGEARLLASLLSEISVMLDDPESDDPVVRRLYPVGYSEDDGAAAEFRDLVSDGLRTERLERIAACRAELPMSGGRIELAPEALDRWLRVLNDIRLGLGTRLGVSETEELDAADEAVNVYHWLSAVQELLVSRAMA